MAIEDLIAQRIAAISAERRGLTSLRGAQAPLQSALGDLALLQQRRYEVDARTAAEKAEKEAAASEDRIPEIIARPTAEAFFPETPEALSNIPATVPGTGIPVAPGLGPTMEMGRQAKVNTLVSALGAEGGAKLMAKLAFYSAAERVKREEAEAKLKIAATTQEGVAKQEAAREGSSAFIEAHKARGGDTTGMTPDMDIVTLRQIASQEGIANRYNTTRDDRMKREALEEQRYKDQEKLKAELRAEAKSAKEEGGRRMAEKTLLNTINQQINDIQSRMATNRMESRNSLTGAITVQYENLPAYTLDQQRLQALEQERIAIKGSVEAEASANGELEVLLSKVEDGTATPEEKARFLELTGK